MAVTNDDSFNGSVNVVCIIDWGRRHSKLLDDLGVNLQRKPEAYS